MYHHLQHAPHYKPFFQTQYTLNQRINLFNHLSIVHPDKIPVVMERALIADLTLPYLRKYKLLIPLDSTMGYLKQYIIRLMKRQKTPMDPKKTLFLFLDNVIYPATTLVSEVYSKHRNPNDNFLYISYCHENTFGTK